MFGLLLRAARARRRRSPARTRPRTNMLVQRLGERAVDRPVEADDAAERRPAGRGERLVEGLERRAADRDAARVVVLDDRARRAARTPRSAGAPESRSSRLLNDSSLPCELATPSRAGACARRPARSRRRAGAGSRRRRGRRPSRTRACSCAGKSSSRSANQREIAAVVAGGVGERLGGQRSRACAQREPAVDVRAAPEHRVVALRADDDRGEGEVLRRRADQRRPADVDVLDHLVRRSTPRRAADALERVEVHAHEVDRARSRARRASPCAPRSSRSGEQAGVDAAG